MSDGSVRDVLTRIKQRLNASSDFANANAEWHALKISFAQNLHDIFVRSHRDGSPLVEPMRSLRDQLCRDRVRRAETNARRAPTLMLFPLVFCILPAFILLIVIPVLASDIQMISQMFE